MADEYVVIVTSEDDAIVPYANDNRREKSPIVGSFHKVCDATIQVFPSSRSHNAIVCSGRCRLRIPIPVGLTTLGQLSDHFQRFNQGKL